MAILTSLLAAVSLMLQPRVTSGTPIFATPTMAQGEARAIILDFPSSLAYFGSGSHRLTDCSDNETMCVSSEYVEFALPKYCGALNLASEWKLGGISTKVYSIRGPESELPPLNYTEVIIGNDKTPWRLYEYNSQYGVVGVFYDVHHRKDFRKLALEGRLHIRDISLIPPEIAGDYFLIRYGTPYLAMCSETRPGADEDSQ